MSCVASLGRERDMRPAHSYVLGLVLVFFITFGVPVVVTGLNAPLAPAVQALFVDDVAAQDCSAVGGAGSAAGTGGAGGAAVAGPGGPGGPGGNGAVGGVGSNNPGGAG